MIMAVEFEITRIGERGQVVIPLAFRERMKIGKGEKFMILEQEGSLILRRIKMPNKEEIRELLDRTRERAKHSGLTEEDVEDAIKRVRARKNESRP